MIRQQNVSSRVKPHFDPFSFPSVCLSSERNGWAVWVCACVWGRGRQRKQGSIWVHSYTYNDLFYVRALRESIVRKCIVSLSHAHTHTYTETHKTNTEAFCVSPSATDLPFVYSALPGYSLWFGFAHVTLASFCSAVLLLKIASACPGSTASLHKL